MKQYQIEFILNQVIMVYNFKHSLHLQAFLVQQRIEENALMIIIVIVITIKKKKGQITIRNQ